jgi:hemerythrin-like domain-containing protein
LLSSLFLSKNQKLVKRWTKEHEEIIFLIHKVLAEYSKNNHKNAKRLLKSLNHLIVDHVTHENTEFYKLLKDEKRTSLNNRKATREFVDSFTGMRLDLMRFLTHYTKKETSLDDDFFTTLNEILDILKERIDFEEANLYTLLNTSRSEERRKAKEWEQMKRRY